MDGMQASGPAEMMNKLQTLQVEDPEKFQDVMNQIANEIESAASEEEDTTGSTSRLNYLAAKFREAAKSGDLSILQPPPPPSFSDSMDPGAQYQNAEESSQVNMIGGQSQDAMRTRMQDLFSKIFGLIDNATKSTAAVE
jgi:hypothetical protein